MARLTVEEQRRSAYYHICRILNPKAATPDEISRAVEYFLANCDDGYDNGFHDGYTAGIQEAVETVDEWARRE